MNWQKLADSMPKEDEIVFLLLNDEGVPITAYLTVEEGEIYEYEKDNGRSKQYIKEVTLPRVYFSPKCLFGDYCGQEEIELEEIVYWAPIPELPDFKK